MPNFMIEFEDMKDGKYYHLMYAGNTVGEAVKQWENDAIEQGETYEYRTIYLCGKYDGNGLPDLLDVSECYIDASFTGNTGDLIKFEPSIRTRI